MPTLSCFTKYDVFFFFLYSLFSFSAFPFALKVCLWLRLAPFCRPSPSTSLCNACVAVCFHLCSSSIHPLLLFRFREPCAVGRWCVRDVFFCSRLRFFLCVRLHILYGASPRPRAIRFVDVYALFLLRDFVRTCHRLCVCVCVSPSLFFFRPRAHFFLSVLRRSSRYASPQVLRAAPHRSFPLKVSVVRMRALCLRQEIMEGMVARRGRSCAKAT